MMKMAAESRMLRNHFAGTSFQGAVGKAGPELERDHSHLAELAPAEFSAEGVRRAPGHAITNEDDKAALISMDRDPFIYRSIKHNHNLSIWTSLLHPILVSILKYFERCRKGICRKGICIR